MILPDQIRSEIKTAILAGPADLDRIARHLAAFRDRFGPEALAGLDGEALLRRMHGRQGEDKHRSLAYWLEFKNDDEFQHRTLELPP